MESLTPQPTMVEQAYRAILDAICEGRLEPGERLTQEEREAIGRWQRLSPWRKGIAIGAFSFGTFGLGFTLGGLVFGRWRKA